MTQRLFDDAAALEARSAKNRAAWRKPGAAPAPAPAAGERVVLEAAPEVRSKHGARKCEVDGFVFDSVKEARAYQRLRNLEAIGAVRRLELQALIPCVINGRRVCDYVADFMFEEQFDLGLPTEGWRAVVADAKSAHTRTLPVYRLKRELVEALLGVTIRELD